MRKVLVVAIREYVAAVKTKSFVIGIILMPVMLGGGFAVQILLGDHVDMEPKRFAVVDHSPGQQFYALLAKAAEQHNQMHADAMAGSRTQAPFLLEQVSAPAGTDLGELRLALSERVRKGQLTGFLEIGPEILQPPPGAVSEVPSPVKKAPGGKTAVGAETYGLRYQTNRSAYQAFPQWAQAIIHADVLARRADKKGLAVTDVNAIVQPVPMLTKVLTVRDPHTGEIKEAADQSPIVAMLLPGGLVFLMFLVVQTGAGPMLQGVMEEKMQRIAEVLLGSVRPFQLMLGKLLGMTGVSLTMAIVYLAGAYWAAQHFGYGEYLSADIMIWFLVYQVLAVFMYGSIYGAVGAACTDMKEAQAMLAPLALLNMLPFFIWLPVIQEPTSAFATGVSLFPLLTPMLMVARVSIPPGLPWWQPALGVVVMLAMTMLCVYAAGRIFRVGILLQGKGPRLGDLVRWAIRG